MIYVFKRVSWRDETPQVWDDDVESDLLAELMKEGYEVVSFHLFTHFDGRGKQAFIVKGCECRVGLVEDEEG